MKKFLTFLCVVVYDVKMQGAAVGVAVPIRSSSSDGTCGVMVFNPNTGKYEKR